MKQFTPIKVLIFSALSLASFSAFAMEGDGDSNSSGKDITEEEKRQIEEKYAATSLAIWPTKTKIPYEEIVEIDEAKAYWPTKAKRTYEEIVEIDEAKKRAFDLETGGREKYLIKKFQVEVLPLTLKELTELEKLLVIQLKKQKEELKQSDNMIHITLEIEKLLVIQLKKQKEELLKQAGDYMIYDQVKKLSKNERSKTHYIKVIAYLSPCTFWSNDPVWICPNNYKQEKAKDNKSRYKAGGFVNRAHFYLTEEDFMDKKNWNPRKKNWNPRKA